MIRLTIEFFSSSWKLVVLFFSSQFTCSSNISNQSNTCDCKKSWQQEQPFFVQSSSLFLGAVVSSLLDKESTI